MTRRKILVVWSGPDTGTSANLFKALAEMLAERHEVLSAPNDVSNRSKFWRRLHIISREMRRWPNVIRTDTLILHSYAALAFPSMLLAWLMQKRIIVLHWDVYPITINGERLGGIGRRLFDRIEVFAVSLATRVVLPTEDFAAFVDHSEVRYLPLWPSLPFVEGSDRRVRDKSSPVRVAFVGQITLTRGIPQAILRLGKEKSQRFELNIFSPSLPEPDWMTLASNVTVIHRGYLVRNDLAGALSEMDFGLISLHPGLDQPGFPSKVFDYAAAGLPVIYTGRSLPAYQALLQRTGVGVSLGAGPLDWEELRFRIAATIPEAVRSFIKETELTADKVDRAFFEG
jgi:hypothetical protein